MNNLSKISKVELTNDEIFDAIAFYVAKKYGFLPLNTTIVTNRNVVKKAVVEIDLERRLPTNESISNNV